MSVRDIKLTIGDRIFLIKQVPFRGNEANTLPANELAESVAKRLAPKETLNPFRPVDDARKAWEYLSQRKLVKLEIVELEGINTPVRDKNFVIEDIGSVILHTEFQGKQKEFLVGLKANQNTLQLLEKAGVDAFRIDQILGVVGGLNLDNLKKLVEYVNANTAYRLSLPSAEFIRHVRISSDGYLRSLGIRNVWLSDNSKIEGHGIIYDLQESAQFNRAVNYSDLSIGVILEVSKLLG